MTLNFMPTPRLRNESVGSMKVRPTNLFLTNPSLYGSPLARENPIAAGMENLEPESQRPRIVRAPVGKSVRHFAPVPSPNRCRT